MSPAHVVGGRGSARRFKSASAGLTAEQLAGFGEGYEDEGNLADEGDLPEVDSAKGSAKGSVKGLANESANGRPVLRRGCNAQRRVAGPQ